MHELSVEEHLAKLVAFPTISSASNLELLDWIEEFCEPYRVTSRRFYDPTNTKANLLVSVGPDEPSGIVLSGHTDVVPCDQQMWSSDPFILRRDNHRLIGRGSTDMKGFLACCLSVVPQFAKAKLPKPVHLAFSYDEEVGCTGVGDMAEWIGQSDLKPSLAIVGEPSMMRVVGAHKAGAITRVRVKGKPGHSSQPDNYVNAVMIAAQLIKEIENLRQDLKNGPFFDGLTPPYATTQVNTISGGTQLNIVAEYCEFTWELRALPGQDDGSLVEKIKQYASDMLEPAMKAIDPSCSIEFETVAHVPALKRNGKNNAENEIMRMLGQASALAVPYGSEAGIFQAVGTPTIICGPGDIKQAHQPDEFIEISQMDACVDFLRKVSDALENSKI